MKSALAAALLLAMPVSARTADLPIPIVAAENFYGEMAAAIGGDRIVVTEVNDNPNIDVGCEDAILGSELYERIMRGMLDRVRSRKKERVK